MALKLKERTYRRVKKDSILSIKTTAVTGTSYILSGLVDRNTVVKKRWKHEKLKDKTVKFTLKESGVYLARVASAYSGTNNSSIKIEASVKKPDGTQHGSKWTVTQFGKNGDISRAKIRLRMS